VRSLIGTAGASSRPARRAATTDTAGFARLAVAQWHCDRGRLAEELRRQAGTVWLWERYTTAVGGYLDKRGVPCHTLDPEFAPKRLYWWLTDEIREYNQAHPDRPRVRSHDLRKRAVTELYRAGVDVDTAAVALGMTTANARQSYLGPGPGEDRP
jgi:integrase